MVDKTAMNAPKADQAAPVAVARSTGEALVDAMTLAELQWQLAELDLNDAWKRLMSAVVFMVIGAVVGISTIPPLIVVVSLALADAAKLQLWIAVLITSVTALLAAAASLGWGWRGLKRRGILFARSREELRQNAKWFKSILSQTNRSFRSGNGTHSSSEPAFHYR